jgi:hypothetical protein
VRGIPSPFIKIYERGRDTPHPGLLPPVPMRKDFLDEVLGFAVWAAAIPLMFGSALVSSLFHVEHAR